MGKPRAASFRVSFYNDGLVVFLYDEQSAGAIRDANPTLLEGFGEDDATDPVLARLARDGLLVAFELEQDDDIDLEVAVRAPLSKAQQGRTWLPAQRAKLVLPSGTLCIEGYNNLRLTADSPLDNEAGGAVVVPPGEYVVSLYRRPPEGGPVEGDKAEGPRHLIVLTDVNQTEAVERVQPMLRGADAAATILEDWVGNYEIRDGTFVGLARLHSAGRLVSLNMDPRAVEALGVRPGTILDVSIPEAEVELRVAYFTPASAEAVVAAMDGQSPPIEWTAIIQRFVDRGPEWHHVVMSTITTRLDIATEHADRWLRATATVRPSIVAEQAH